MFCFQCEQTAKGEGCTKIGVCGKNHDVASLQDLLIYALKGLSQVAVEGRKVGVTDVETNRFTCKATFSTLTNVVNHQITFKGFGLAGVIMLDTKILELDGEGQILHHRAITNI